MNILRNHLRRSRSRNFTSLCWQPIADHNEWPIDAFFFLKTRWCVTGQKLSFVLPGLYSSILQNFGTNSRRAWHVIPVQEVKTRPTGSLYILFFFFFFSQNYINLNYRQSLVPLLCTVFRIMKPKYQYICFSNVEIFNESSIPSSRSLWPSTQQSDNSLQ